MDNILWTKLFLQDQGVMIDRDILYQENQNSICLENNGKASSGKQTCTINISEIPL